MRYSALEATGCHMTKSEFVKIRLSDDEKAAFQTAAEVSGISLSAWMRERLRSAARLELEDANKPVQFLKMKSE